MKKRVVMIMVLSGALCFAGISNAELILNGGFELNGGNGTAPENWTKDFNCYGTFSGAAYSGLFGLHPGNAGPPGGAYQDITTVAGEYYEVSLWMQNFNFASGKVGNIKILIGNPGSDVYTFENGTDTTSIYSLTGLVDQNLSTNIDGSWSQATFQFQALGTTTRVGVYNAPFSGTWSTNVDDVSVTLVPEPAALILLGLGGLLLRKRR